MMYYGFPRREPAGSFLCHGVLSCGVTVYFIARHEPVAWGGTQSDDEKMSLL